MPIVPDEKDWTWVLERRCVDCGFDASSVRASGVALLIRENSGAWRTLLAAGSICPGRPDDSTWSTLEYACHVRDVYRRYRGRIDMMLNQDDPLFPNWDQDASAIEDAYELQDPAEVVDDLIAAADALALQLERVSGPYWQRPGRRSDGASFTVDTIARYMVHDPIHHVWDVRRQDKT